MGKNNEESNPDSREKNDESSSDEPPEQPQESTKCTDVNTDEGAEKTMIKSTPIQENLQWEKKQRVLTRKTKKPDRWGINDIVTALEKGSIKDDISLLSVIETPNLNLD